ncbi:MAG: twin-arginine translocase subunit TatC [Coriobacteriales bacterium]|jgi:sec-independent protein translocase protein TatC|nr:twin-arginine translocase subunit TatC [Coriobacteriales bacterium]
MPVGQAQMPLFDHLGELRRRLSISVIAILVATIGLYFFSSELILFLIRPISIFLPGGSQINIGATTIVDAIFLRDPVSELDRLRQALYTFEPFEGFAIRFWVAFVFSFLVTGPVWIWQLLAFFLPALKPEERKWVIPTFFVAILLLLVGMVFCYLVILNPAFEWMIEQANEYSLVMPRASQFINTIILFEIGFGVAFELPLVVFYLTVFNIVPYKKLRESWRVVYVTLMVICALVTPDANPITMLLMFAAMLVLYEASLFISRLVLMRRIARENLAADEDDDDDEEDELDEED